MTEVIAKLGLGAMFGWSLCKAFETGNFALPIALAQLAATL